MANRGTNPEDEYFARRAGEIERLRIEREAQPEPHEQARPQRLEHENRASVDAPQREAETKEKRESKVLAAVSTSLKAMFGIRGNRRPRQA